MAYERGLISGTEGNLSIKVSDDLILVTPRNTHKGLIDVNDFITVDASGNQISNGKKQATSELQLHLVAYKQRPDIKAVVHAHSPIVTAFSVAGLDFSLPVIPEIIVLLGEIPTVPYSEPGTEKLAKLAEAYFKKHDAIILDHHGVVTLGENIFNAYFKMESVEHAAKIMYHAHTLGDIKPLDETAVNELIQQRHNTYGKEVQQREGTKLYPPKILHKKRKNSYQKN